MDRQLTKDGKPYGPIRYKQIVQENYIISRSINTTYSDIMNMTPTERGYMMEFIKTENDNYKEMLEKQKQKQEQKSRH